MWERHLKGGEGNTKHPFVSARGQKGLKLLLGGCRKQRYQRSIGCLGAALYLTWHLHVATQPGLHLAFLFRISVHQVVLYRHHAWLAWLWICKACTALTATLDVPSVCALNSALRLSCTRVMSSYSCLPDFCGAHDVLGSGVEAVTHKLTTATKMQRKLKGAAEQI